MTDFHKLLNESETEYIYRICSNKDEIGSWIDVAQLLNVELVMNIRKASTEKITMLSKRFLTQTRKSSLATITCKALENSGKLFAKSVIGYRRKSWSITGGCGRTQEMN